MPCDDVDDIDVGEEVQSLTLSAVLWKVSHGSMIPERQEQV